MSLSWGQAIAGGLALTVVAGLLLLPGRLLGPDRPIQLAIPPSQGTRVVSPGCAAACDPAPARGAPEASRRLRGATSDVRPRNPPGSDVRTVATRQRPARRVQPHRSAVISKLAPTAPLVKARLLAAASGQRPALESASLTAKTIAALAASLRTK